MPLSESNALFFKRPAFVIISTLIHFALVLSKDIDFRRSLSQHQCITSGRKCENSAVDCCEGLNCYKRSKRDYKRCVPCREAGKSCRYGHHCCSNQCKNNICTSKCMCDTGMYEALDDYNINSAVNLWFEDQSSAEKTYGKIKCWDVQRVTDMTYLFFSQTSFDEDLSCWDVSQVTDMSSMFHGAILFNKNLNSWDVSKVTYMNDMFAEATSFNQNLNSWDVSKVTDMMFMFNSAAKFNGDVSEWNVSQVNDMHFMFGYAESFDQNLNSWDVSKVTDMSYMFIGARSFYQSLCWDVATKDTYVMLIDSGACIEKECCPSCDSSLLCV